MNPFDIPMGVVSGLGNLAGGLFGLFNQKNMPNPADKAMPYLNKIPGVAKEQFGSWIGPATGMMPGMNDLYTNMMQNPGEFFNKIGSGYKSSPGYQYALKEALGAIDNAQAAGGMAGSPQHQKLAAEEAESIASRDFQNYINNVLGIEKTGLAGGESTLGRGFEGSKSLADILASTLSSQAQYAYEGQNAENEANQHNWSNIFSGASSVMPWLFGSSSGKDWRNPGSMPGWEQ